MWEKLGIRKVNHLKTFVTVFVACKLKHVLGDVATGDFAEASLPQSLTDEAGSAAKI